MKNRVVFIKRGDKVNLHIKELEICSFHANTNIDGKGVLIINGFKNKELKSRNNIFPKQYIPQEATKDGIVFQIDLHFHGKNDKLYETSDKLFYGRISKKDSNNYLCILENSTKDDGNIIESYEIEFKDS